MKALTIQQPWAWAIAAGLKDVENRTQLWQHRGPVAIHAGGRRSDRGEQDPRIIAAVRAKGLKLDPIKPLGLPLRWNGDVEKAWPRSAVIGVADLTGGHYEDECGGSCSQWAESVNDPPHLVRKDAALVHLVFENARQLRYPIPLRGQLGLWTLTSDIAADVKRQTR